MNPLKITSIQSEVADFSCKMIAEHISRQLAIPIEFIDNLPWQEREDHFDRGEIQVCWMCSLPYAWRRDGNNPSIELLAAPVMKFERYQNRPIYFSDVVVHRDSRFHTFADLRGASWAYNEPNSHSGYNLTRYQLAMLGETFGYFGNVIGSGAHVRSLEMVLKHQVDASAIDSTVLDLILAHRPEIANVIRVIETWGPSPIPPWVVHTGLDSDLSQSLREALMAMHKNRQGREILDQGQIDHFTIVQDEDYDIIRRMYQTAQQVRLSPADP
jgi:phosphonate transport system substrate-binding protein